MIPREKPPREKDELYSARKWFNMTGRERQITFTPGGHILTNAAVWSPDSRRLVYDTRSDADGAIFDGTRIETVDMETGATACLYESRNGACCGVATFHPCLSQVVFILGPECPTADWQYAPAHRQGVVVDTAFPGEAMPLDARNLVFPFTPGALRGGSHVHQFSAASPHEEAWVSFTYNDALLPNDIPETPIQERDLRGVGISVPIGAVRVPQTHPRNHDGSHFSVLVTRLTAQPAPGSDAILSAVEEGWIGTRGYRRADGRWQRRALAFQGTVVTPTGQEIREVFLVDVPDDVTHAPDDAPLTGTAHLRPRPPLGTVQQRLTCTADRRFPGIQGVRHWLRSTPDGSQIAFLMRDDAGIVQIWTAATVGGALRQITRDAWNVASAFTWHPDGTRLAYIADNSLFVVEADTGQSHRLTPRCADADAPLPLACVFSPDGRHIAYLRRVLLSSALFALQHNQVFVCTLAK